MSDTDGKGVKCRFCGDPTCSGCWDEIDDEEPEPKNNEDDPREDR